MDSYQIMICGQLDQLERQASELSQWCENSVENLLAKCPNYYQFLNQLIAARSSITLQQELDLYNCNSDLLSHMRQTLVNEAYQIVDEHKAKLDGFIPFVKSIYDDLQAWICDSYQSEHRFAMRSSKFSYNLCLLDIIDSQLSRIFTQLRSHQIPGSHFQQLFQTISQIIMDCGAVQEYANHFNDLQKISILVNPQTYQTNDIFQKLEDLKWPLIKQCLVITQQPPPVVPIDGSRPFSLKLLKVQSLLKDQNNFLAKVCLVSEATAKDIRLNDRIPEYITSILRGENQRVGGEGSGGRARHSNYYCGAIFLDGNGQCFGDHNVNQVAAEELAPRRARRVRSNESQDPLVHATGSTVQYLNGERTLNMKCCCFERKLVVKGKPIKRTGETQKATDKFVLLVAMEVGSEAEEKRLVWTFSMPFCLTTNSSQYLKAWTAIVWNEAVGNGARLDFEMGEDADKAPWYKVKEVFKGTFHCLVGQPMKDSDLAFIKTKIEEIYFGGTVITDDTEIRKSYLFVHFKIANGQTYDPIFTWFFESVAVVQKDSYLHEIYINGYIAGFVSIQNCLDKLEEGVNAGTIENGSFMVRFSDNNPGGLTFVLASNSREDPTRTIVTRWDPLKTKQLNSIRDFAEAVVKHLSQKERDDPSEPEAFQTLYPSNEDKKAVFKKFYDEVARNREISRPWWASLTYVPGSSGNVRNLNLDSFAAALKRLCKMT